MKTLAFFARVAFLYNLCMIAAFGMRYQVVASPGAIQSTILVSGIVLSVIFSGAVSVWALLLLLLKVPPGAFRPQ